MLVVVGTYDCAIICLCTDAVTSEDIVSSSFSFSSPTTDPSLPRLTFYDHDERIANVIPSFIVLRKQCSFDICVHSAIINKLQIFVYIYLAAKYGHDVCVLWFFCVCVMVSLPQRLLPKFHYRGHSGSVRAVAARGHWLASGGSDEVIK